MNPTTITPLENFETTYVSMGTYRLLRGEYAYGGTAIMAEDADTGEPAFVLSVYIEGMRPDGPHTFWAKTWSENEGIAEELERRGIIRFTGVTVPTGFVTAREAVICEEYR